MAIELTDEQLTAVNAPVSENLVSAAAGSGKTKVLTERIVKRIKSGDTTIDRLLIVTFTKAAAAQMRERIAQAMEEEYKKCRERFFKRQLALIAGADICTIDSFCINLVKRNFFRAEVPPDFVIADANEMKILREEILIDVIDEMYEKNDENFMLLAESVGNGKSDKELRDMILKAYLATRSFAEPDDWLDKALKYHEKGSEENNSLYEFIASEISAMIDETRRAIKKALDEAVQYGVESYIGLLENEYQSFEKHFDGLKKEDWESKLSEFSFISFPGGRRKSEEGLVNEKQHIRDTHKEAKDIYSSAISLFEIYNDERGVSYPKIKALTDCVRRFDKMYTDEKISRKQLEFSDCEYLALKILRNSPEVCDELRDKYDEIYIDEYQDTNPLQDALFMAVSRKSCGESNLFIVGDVKQSIYRFRHSDPGVFAQKTKNLGNDENSCKMVLSRNFRSRRDVIDSVNSVFEKIMRESTAQVDYNDEHALKCGAVYTEYNRNKSELYILKGKYEDVEEDEITASEHRETLVAAWRIKKLMDEGFMVSENGRMRNLKYSDIAVLSPKISNKAEAIVSVFNLMGIPVYCESKDRFFDTIEIETIVSVLRCVDNPMCDIPLASVMRSPIFAFSENELAEIREDGRHKPFYENVAAISKKRTRLARRCKRFIETLNSWRETAQVMGLERFITRVVDEYGYYSFVGALPGGRARQANLRRFILLAANYEKGQFKGLYNFVRYIDKSIENECEIETDICRAENSALVTSIHKSKGLEFPVVIVIGCGWKFNDKDATGSMVLNPECSMAVAEREKNRRVKFKTAEYSAISMMITNDNHAEQMRLLYVAMTRAKEKLILIGSSDKYMKTDIKDSLLSGERLSDFKIRSMKTYLDYVANSIDERYWEVHKIDELPPLAEKAEDIKERTEYKTIEEAVYRLSYMYPYDGVLKIPSKMSVSEIKKMSTDTDESVKYYQGAIQKRIPSFMSEYEKLQGANRGTAYHRVMELMDLNEKDVKSALEDFVKRKLMSKAQAECIDVEKIERFLQSDIAEMMRHAKKLWKEESFTIEIDGKDVFENGENEKICVQGTIDCFFETADGRLVLVDYKTDSYKDEAEIRQRYKKQLDLYEVAIFTRFGKKCDEKYLYMFQNGDIINTKPVFYAPQD